MAVVVWLTGLSGSGKTTVAKGLIERMDTVIHLDGDVVRSGLCSDLRYTEADRSENVRRVAYVAQLINKAGVDCIVSFISPCKAMRLLARSLVPRGNFVEVYLSTPISECERRDPKGLYGKVRRGELYGFTGIDQPYEAPEYPEMVINTKDRTVESVCDEIMRGIG